MKIECTCTEEKKNNNCMFHGINKGNIKSYVNRLNKAGLLTIKHGDGSVEKKIKYLTWKDKKLNYTDKELKAMSKEELWEIVNILQLPQRNPVLNYPGAQKIDLLRHVKAATGKYSSNILETKYFQVYPFMRGIVPIKRD